jgi:hypothetical protein
VSNRCREGHFQGVPTHSGEQKHQVAKLMRELRVLIVTPAELSVWQREKVLPTRIKHYLAGKPTMYLLSTLYALYRSDIIEKWINRLQNPIGSLERLLKAELGLQTAGHMDDLNQENFHDLEKAKRLMKSLSNLAKTL